MNVFAIKYLVTMNRESAGANYHALYLHLLYINSNTSLPPSKTRFLSNITILCWKCHKNEQNMNLRIWIKIQGSNYTPPQPQPSSFTTFPLLPSMIFPGYLNECAAGIGQLARLAGYMGQGLENIVKMAFLWVVFLTSSWWNCNNWQIRTLRQRKFWDMPRCWWNISVRKQSCKFIGKCFRYQETHLMSVCREDRTLSDCNVAITNKGNK